MDEGMARVSAVLFDMDGVLIEARDVIERAWREAAELYGRLITEADLHAHIHGRPGPHTIGALFSDLPRSDRERVQAHVMHVENTADYLPVPGVTRLLASLGEAGLKVGIVTSGWRGKVDRVVELLQARSYISTIVERDDVARGKPHPDPYLLAAERLGLSASRTTVFEDSGSGVTSAVTAGAVCIGIGGEELMGCGARFCIPHFEGVELRPSAPGDGFTLTFPSERQLFLELAAAGP